MMAPLHCAVRPLATGLALLVALVAWPSARVEATPVMVTGVSVQEAPGELQVLITTSGPARYQQLSVRPEWVVVDVMGAELGVAAGRLPFSGGPISRVRVGQFGADVVRVVVELVQPVRSRLGPAQNGMALVIGIPASGATGRANATRRGETVQGALPKVTEISVWGAADKPWVSIAASGPVRYQLRNVEPDWVVLDVSRAHLALDSGKPPAGRGIVKQIRVGQFAPDVVRVVLELAERVPIHVATSPDRAAIVVSFKEAKGSTGNRIQPADQRVGTDLSAASAPAPTTVQPEGAQPSNAGLPQLVASSGSAGAGPAAPTVPLPVSPQPPASQGTGRYSAGPYLLGPEDVLEITVWGYPDMTRVVTVRPDGQVAVPLAGSVTAGGRSVERLTQDLTRAFAKYIINPQVSVIVKEFRKIRVSILGQVTHPGTYTLPPGTRILDALSAASGVTDNAALPEAQLVRTSGRTQPISLDGLLIQQDLQQNFALEPGDTLIIPEDTKNKFYVLGDVNHPGIYPLKGDVTVLQALAVAGGPVLHGTSTSTTAHIVRRTDNSQGPLTASVRAQDVHSIANGGGVLITMDLKKMYKGDLRQNETLRPGDVMVVPAPGAAALPTILGIISTILLGIRP
jgi:polysaccharide biosynthesis/export protein